MKMNKMSRKVWKKT